MYLLAKSMRHDTYRHINQFDPESISDQIIGKHRSALKSGIGPFVPVWVGNVQLGDGNSMDLVGGLGHRSLDSQFVVVVEN